MDKTDSINDRRVDVYLESIEQKKRWAELAEERDTSLSKFVQESVEYAIEQGGPNFIESGQKAEELQELEDEITKLKEQVEEKDLVIEKLRTELKSLRTTPFREEDFEGKRRFDEELVGILRDAGHIRSEEIFRRLNVDSQNIEVVEGVQKQLSQLEKYGIVEETVNGWRWCESS